MTWAERPLDDVLRAELAGRLNISQPSYSGILKKHARIFRGIWVAAPGLAVLIAITQWLTAEGKSASASLILGITVSGTTAALMWVVAAGLAFGDYREQKKIAANWARLDSIDELYTRISRARVCELPCELFQTADVRALVLELDAGKLAVLVGAPCEALITGAAIRDRLLIRKIPPVPYSYLLDFSGDPLEVRPMGETPGIRDVLPVEDGFLVYEGRLETWAADFNSAPNFMDSGWVV